MPTNILVPIDGSPESSRALAFAVEEWPEAAVTLLHVIDPVEAGYGATGGIPSGAEQWYENAKGQADELFDRVGDDFGREFDTETEVGRPASTIVDFAEEGRFDHVVMGSHGRKGVSRILLGSVAESVVRNSPVPVTVVRNVLAEGEHAGGDPATPATDDSAASDSATADDSADGES
ncbi:universal stress protein [Salinirubrum litoreum]|uniref:Universal stress protein n=1 Tax=Salinirubrum litoreum TaxID=1126234 RepID=A0ABD5RE55_9EURY